MAKPERLLIWLKKPPSVLALLAFVVSLFSFIYPLPIFHSGSLEILMADDVAISFREGGINSIVVPIAFLNTGSAEHWKIVKRLVIKMRIPGENGEMKEMDFRWNRIVRLISVEEYEKQYAHKELEHNPEHKVESAASDAKNEDSFFYESKPVPFGIAGLQSLSKLCQFSPATSDLDTSKLTTLMIAVTATTMEDETYKSRETEFDVSNAVGNSIARHDFQWVQPKAKLAPDEDPSKH